MKIRRIHSNLAWGLVLGLAAACGETDDKPANPGGGGSSTMGGSATAGTVSGGTATSGAGTAGTTMTPGGGTGAVAGMGAGGAGMPPNGFGCPEAKPEAGAECMRRGGNACEYGQDSCVCNDSGWECYSQSDCPASAPDDAAECELNGMSCTYDTLRCTCSTMGGWSCTEPCPEAEPDNDAACRRPAGATCRYAAGMIVQNFMGMADTTCACNDGKFACFTQEDCPADAPSTGDACDMATLACTFTGERCTCGVNGEWTCTTDCPATLPADGVACERSPQQVCRYSGDMLATGAMQSDGSCTCRDNAFECVTQADCPGTKPETNTACDLGGLTCRYDAESCRCGVMSGNWTCFTPPPGPGGEGGAGGAAPVVGDAGAGGVAP